MMKLALVSLIVALAAPVAARADGTPPPPPPPPPVATTITLTAPAASSAARAGRLLTLTARAVDAAGAAVGSGSVACTARAGAKKAAVQSTSLSNGVARCVIRVPAGSAGKRLTGSLSVSQPSASATRAFSLPIGR